MENIFKEEIQKFIELLLETFSISFRYKFDEQSKTHLFQVLDEEIYSSKEFQDMLSEQIYDLIKKGMYHGICFIELNDKTISFEGANLYTSIEKEEVEFTCQEVEDTYITVSTAAFGLNLKQIDMNPLFSSLLSFSDLELELMQEVLGISGDIETIITNESYALAA